MRAKFLIFGLLVLTTPVVAIWLSANAQPPPDTKQPPPGPKKASEPTGKEDKEGSLTDASNTYGYSAARTLVQVLKQCGDNLTRENVMKQAANLKNFDTGMGLPGILINTTPTDFAPISAVQLMKFDGKSWVRFGDVIDSTSSK